MSQLSLNTTAGRLALLATILASGLAFLDSSIVNVALPSIQASLSLTLSGIQWVSNGYYLTLGAFIVTAGALGDRYGHRRIFLAGIALFTLSSVACGLAPSAALLIAARIVQGIGGALMVPGSLALIMRHFPQAEHGRAIGYWAGLSGAISALGPFIGGLLVEQSGWPAVFYLSVPLGIVAFFVARSTIPVDAGDEAHGIDWYGSLALLVALTGIAVGLTNGPMTGWAPRATGALAIGLVALVGFVGVEARAPHPMVPLSLFRRTVAGANLATFLVYGSLGALFFFLALHLQQLQGYSPATAGLAMLPPVVLITLLAGPFGGLSARYGLRAPLVLGILIVALAMILLSGASLGEAYRTAYLPGLLLFGLGMSFVIAPITQAALAVPSSYTGAASGVNNAVARVAGLVFVALLGGLAVSLFRTELTTTLAPLSMNESVRAAIIAEAPRFGEATIPASLSDDVRADATAALQAALAQCFQIVFLVLAGSVGLAAAVIAFTIPGKQSNV